MSFLMYQRSDPRNKDWPPFITQQIRLRNIIQIIGINIETSNHSNFNSPKRKSPTVSGGGGKTTSNNNNSDDDITEEIYFTLHSRPMSVPFYTSDKLKIELGTNKTKNKILTWKEIEPRDISETVRLSTTGCIVCIWSSSSGQQKTIVSWGVIFQGLFCLGPKADWNSNDFKPNTIIFHAPFGYFTSLDSLIKKATATQRFAYFQVPRPFCRLSYNVKNLATLHGVQRSVLEEVELARQLKSSITLYGYSPELCGDVNSASSSPSLNSSLVISEKTLIRIRQGRAKLRLKEESQNVKLKLNVLRDEKEKALRRISKLKADKLSQEVSNNSLDLLNRMQSLGREKSRLFQLKVLAQERKRLLTDMSSKLFTRRKQLISELLLIYPITLVEGSKRYSINEVQLPNAEDYGSEGGGQISVALGYTAHMAAMLSFFLGIPLRYPINHFGSRSRIIDHITMQIPEKEREFPLYFRSKEDVYSKYAVYLLNKNISQIRWYCGLSSSDLRASLPNLLNLLTTRLTIPGWPPSPGESLEIAQELTEEVDQQLFRSESSLSLDKGLDQLDQREKEIENTWFRSSFSDLECAGGNVVPSGEVRHSRAQDRFLNGWRKKTYESEDIDSNWLINSLNIDFDGGRRLSSSSASSVAAGNKLTPTPLIFLNDDGLGLQQSKSRRQGRFEKQQAGNKTLAVPTAETDNSNLTASANSTPNENMTQVENHIKQFERKRSFCNDGHQILSMNSDSRSRGRRHSTPMTKESTETDQDRFSDRVADFARRVSLAEMQLHHTKTADIGAEKVEQLHNQVKEEDESDDDISSLVEIDPMNNVELSDRELLFSKPESPPHLSTKYFEQSSGDERGDTPSPSFLRKPSRQDLNASESKAPFEKINETIPNPNTCSVDQVPADIVSTPQSPSLPVEGMSTLNTTNSTSNYPCTHDTTSPSEKKVSFEGSSVAEQHNSSQTSFCDNDIINSSATSHDDSDEDSSLWFRTEALVTTSKSFNMVKRRISESN